MIKKEIKQHSIEELRVLFEEKIQLAEFENQPSGLYAPINYLLQIGGKRVRPVCTMAACELFGHSADEAINQAIAVEVFHNFTLMHDDIMDEAPLRRGESTVHHKWNINTAILSGDAMMVIAYQYLQKNSGRYLSDLTSCFNTTAIKVCEGQQYDMDFEKRESVSLDEYISMITRKTAVLLGESLRVGAIMAGASKEDNQLIYDFGKNFGIAFQLQDDILDLYADPDKFGKQVGGDILACKKSYLYAKAITVANAQQKQKLIDLYNSETLDPSTKIQAVQSIFDDLDIRNLARADMNRYFLSAGIALNSINVPDEKKQILKTFAESLMVREL